MYFFLKDETYIIKPALMLDHSRLMLCLSFIPVQKLTTQKSMSIVSFTCREQTQTGLKC